MVLCPRCDGQGNIYNARIVQLEIQLSICDECEACWVKDDEICLKNFKDLSTFLEKHGLSYKDSKIENLGFLE